MERREGVRKTERKGGREGRKEGGKEGGREGGREGGKEGGREGREERRKERRKRRKKERREKYEHTPFTQVRAPLTYHIDSVYMFSLLEFLTTNPPSFACVNRKIAFMDGNKDKFRASKVPHGYHKRVGEEETIC